MTEPQSATAGLWERASNTLGDAAKICIDESLRVKKREENFRCLVRQCLSRENILKTEQIRMFSQWAHHYICVYHKLWQQQQQNDANSEPADNDGSNGTLSINVEKLMKKFKMHRCVLDFDHTFCKAIYIDIT